MRMDNPLIVLSDKTILVEVDNPLYPEVRDYLSRFAEVVKTPNHIHTYKISNISLWNASTCGITGQEIIDFLNKYSKYDVPYVIRHEILDQTSKYGKLKMLMKDDNLILYSDDTILLTEIEHYRGFQDYITGRLDNHNLIVHHKNRGHIKRELVRRGWPIEDLAGYREGKKLDIKLLPSTVLRPYQLEAIETFMRSGAGVIVLPCGAGKTITGIKILECIGESALIVCTSVTACRQWQRELAKRTNIPRYRIGEYSKDRKEIRPITTCTYNILVWRKEKSKDYFPHLELFDSRSWGILIADECHLIPSPLFRKIADIQAVRRLGLTATLIREDNKQGDCFSLLGPKRYDSPWKDLEQHGWIASAICHEVRVSMPDKLRYEYAICEDKKKYRLSAENPIKFRVVEELIQKHEGDKILVIGEYINQLERVSKILGKPLVMGKTPNNKRQELYNRFLRGDLDILVLSRVGDFALDLPDANVLIQISGMFGSRMEEGQRLGRVLRRKKDGSPAHFYSIVTKDTKDQVFNAKRQRFLLEMGYRYSVVDWDKK